MNLTELIAELREENPEASIEKLAELVLEAVFDSENPAELAYPALLAYVTTAERSRVRAKERRSAPFKPTQPSTQAGSLHAVTDADTDGEGDLDDQGGEYVKPGTDEDPAIIARRELMRENAYVPGRGYVAWGCLTIGDHESIVDFLRKRIGGYEATIAKHVEAIEVLEMTGAQTLDDLYAEVELAA